MTGPSTTIVPTPGDTPEALLWFQWKSCGIVSNPLRKTTTHYFFHESDEKSEVYTADGEDRGKESYRPSVLVWKGREWAVSLNAAGGTG